MFLLKVLSMLRSAAEIAAMYADLTSHRYLSAQMIWTKNINFL